MKALSRLLIAAIGAAAFISCTQNGGLIYTNIQKTTKTNTSNSIPLDITVGDMVNVGSGTSPYYAAVGKIYNGTISNGSTSWSPMAVPQTNGKDMLCNTLTWDGTSLWGGFYSSDGSTFGLYSSPPAPPGGNLAWTPAAGFPNQTQQIAYVNYTGGNLFVVVATWNGSVYTYQLDTGASLAPTNITGAAKPITGVALAGSTYYVTTGNTLYTTSTGFTNFVSVAPTPLSFNSNDILQGIFVDSGYTGTLIIIPSSNPTSSTQGYGNIYWSVDGGTSWSASSQQVSSYNVGFLCVAGPTDAGHTTYLLGTDSGTGGAFGFYSFVPSTNALNRFAGLSYSLYYSAVRRIMVDIPNNIVAMGTINNGLWVTTPIDNTGNNYLNNTWTQE